MKLATETTPGATAILAISSTTDATGSDEFIEDVVLNVFVPGLLLFSV
jgi:hypothetical protein